MSTVTCSNCGEAAPAGMRFCGHCAAPLPPVCPACGGQNPAGMKCCGFCGGSLSAPASSPPGARPASSITVPASPEVLAPAAHAVPADQERRLVTILFADLVGSATLGESLDPDALYELTDHAPILLEACVQRYPGHVARHLGDGLV